MSRSQQSRAERLREKQAVYTQQNLERQKQRAASEQVRSYRIAANYLQPSIRALRTVFQTSHLVLLHVYSFLDAPSVLAACRSCKTFREPLVGVNASLLRRTLTQARLWEAELVLGPRMDQLYLNLAGAERERESCQVYMNFGTREYPLVATVRSQIKTLELQMSARGLTYAAYQSLVHQREYEAYLKLSDVRRALSIARDRRLMERVLLDQRRAAL